MKSRALPFLFSLAASVLIAPVSQAAGMIVIDPIMGGMPVITPRPSIVRPGTRPGTRPVTLLKGQVSFGLRLQDADVRVEINDQVAKTYITQTFINDTDRNLAGTYLFPLPEDTTFSSFSLHIDGKPVEGKILEAQEARQQYEEIVRRMVDPGLLEYADNKTVRARIFPIPARGTKKVELEYTQVLKAENGLLKYHFPLKTEGESSPADEIKIRVKLGSKQGLRTIWSPSHVISSQREGDHKANVNFSGKDMLPDKDFLLYYSVSDKDMSANLITHKDSDADGYYMMTLTPPVEAKQIINKDIVFVADISGSMKGERMEQNKRALKYLVNALGAGDRFSIVQFNTDADAYKTNLVQATPENKKSAISFINDMEASGGTNIGDALKTAQSMLGAQKERPSYLVLMTDGEPTVGETSVNGLVKVVDPKKDIRLFDFGVGYDVNTKLLNKLAESNHGTSQYVEPEESLEVALSNFYDKIKSPVLSNVKLTYNGITVKNIYPREVKDIFAGSQVLLMGQYKGSGNATVQMTGTVNGVAKSYSFPLKFEQQSVAHSYLPRLWAMRRIAHLTEAAQSNGENREIIDEIIALSKKYGIISNYTSFLVTDPSENGRLANNRPVPGMPRPIAMPSAVPQGFGGGGNADGISWTEANRVQKRSVSGGASGGAGGVGWSSGPFNSSDGARAGGTWHAAREAQIIDQRPVLRDFRMAQRASLPMRQNANATALPPTAVSNGLSVFGDEGMTSAPPYQPLADNESTSGKSAVVRAKLMNRMKDTVAVDSDKKNSAIKTADDKTFYLKDGFWVDSSYSANQKLTEITFGTPQYFDLMKNNPGISKYLSVGRQLVLVFKGHAYRISFKHTV